MILPVARAQNGAPPNPPPAQTRKGSPASPRISLTPRFVPGQAFRYEMEFETTASTSRSGIVSDPQGPSTSVIDWNATVRINVLPADPGTPGGIRLRTTYEKSAATSHSDTFDPTADETREQYQKLEGKVIEFTLDAHGKVKSMSNLAEIVDGEKAALSVRQWVAEFSASAGAPPGGVVPGQTWSSEERADSQPLAGYTWRSDAEYLHNEPCHPPNPNLPSAVAAAESATKSQAVDACAVILMRLSLIHSKQDRDPTPPEFRKSGMRTAGDWSGSGQSLMYVSLATGLVVSVTQTGAEQMDVTLTTSGNSSIHYKGTMSSRTQVELAGENPATK